MQNCLCILHKHCILHILFIIFKLQNSCTIYFIKITYCEVWNLQLCITDVSIAFESYFMYSLIWLSLVAETCTSLSVPNDICYADGMFFGFITLRC